MSRDRRAFGWNCKNMARTSYVIGYSTQRLVLSNPSGYSSITAPIKPTSPLFVHIVTSCQISSTAVCGHAVQSTLFHDVSCGVKCGGAKAFGVPSSCIGLIERRLNHSDPSLDVWQVSPKMKSALPIHQAAFPAPHHSQRLSTFLSPHLIAPHLIGGFKMRSQRTRNVP